MFALGSALALICGIANSAAAALEKREMMRLTVHRRGLALLGVLIRRPWWMVAMALSAIAWVSEAGALGLAPVPVVTTLRSAGRGGLVLAGHHWLGERFGRVELLGVILLGVGGVLTASSVISTGAAQPPLSNLTLVLLALVLAVPAAALSMTGSGLMMGAAVGILFIATGVYTKELADRFIRHGVTGVLQALATPGPWLMIALSVWSITMIQHAFARSNAATVSAASTTVSANGLIIAGVILYREPLASGAEVIPLTLGIVLSAIGALALVARELYALRRG
ncbi:MAG: hypothetical protein FWD04_04400 [Conexibacteraceae bacterium]|nr:hypothetical protein [Conexibacteraceae bacterium]